MVDWMFVKHISIDFMDEYIYIPLQPEPFKIIGFEHKHRVFQKYPKNIGFVPKTSGFG